jgi:hypothetical protein
MTPYLITIAIFMLGNLINTVNKIDDKLFKHLTNDEIHIPRNTVVSRAEFDLVSTMRERQFNQIDNKLGHMEGLLEKHVGIKE